MNRALPIALALLVLAGSALAVPEGWHSSLEDGKQAARRSGKPILVVTAWKPQI